MNDTLVKGDEYLGDQVEAYLSLELLHGGRANPAIFLLIIVAGLFLAF